MVEDPLGSANRKAPMKTKKKLTEFMKTATFFPKYIDIYPPIIANSVTDGKINVWQFGKFRVFLVFQNRSGISALSFVIISQTSDTFG